jgi:AsmA family protein
MDMKRGLFFARLGWGGKVALGTALFAVVFVLLFDWNWLRQPLVDYLARKSNREIRIEHLEVDSGFTLEPTIRLKGVYIQNAPWAGERPFATAAQASFTVSLQSLWERRPVISRLVLVDADVDMQREADGRRNWRLKRPDDRSPGHVTVHTLEAHRTSIRFINREIDLEFTGRATPVENPADGLKTRITFEGSYRDAPYKGTAFIADILSFRGSGVSFPLRGHMTARNARIEVDGLFSDLFDVGAFDSKVHLTGSTLSALHPFLRIQPPPSRAFDIRTQLTQAGDVYEFKDLKAKSGRQTSRARPRTTGAANGGSSVRVS